VHLHEDCLYCYTVWNLEGQEYLLKISQNDVICSSKSGSHCRLASSYQVNKPMNDYAEDSQVLTTSHSIHKELIYATAFQLVFPPIDKCKHTCFGALLCNISK
jgi:hypothetical protein